MFNLYLGFKGVDLMKKSDKGILLFLLALVTVTLSIGFVSASENMTGEVILDDVSSQEPIDEIDDGLEESVQLETSKIDTKISVKDSNSYYKEKIKINIYLKDSNNVALNNKSVTVYFNGKVSEKTTDDLGKVSLSYSNLKPNTYEGVVKFEGDGQYNASEAGFNVKINKIPLTIKTKNFNAYENANMFFKATVTNKVTGTPVSGIRVLFKVYSAKTKKYTNFYSTTDKNGVATLNKNLKAGSYKISTLLDDSKNKKYVSFKSSGKKVTMEVKQLADEDCCSFFLQVSNTESVAGFRRDNTGKTTITVKEYKLGGIPVMKHTNAGGFVHLIVFANGWIVGNGGLDSFDFINSMQKLAVDMVKSNKIKMSSLKKIYRYKHNINFGHFSIKAPDGRYAVVWKNKIITGKLKPGEFSCSPNFKEYYRHSTYKKYSTNPAKAAIKVGATDHYGVNRRQVVVLHWKATTDKNFKTTSQIKAYAANDNGRFVGRSSGGLVDNVRFKSKFVSSYKLPRVPNMKYLGTHKFGNIDKLVKTPTTVKAPRVTGKFNETVYFKVLVKNKKTNKAVSNVKIKIKVSNSNGNIGYTVYTNKNGFVQVKVKDLSTGNHNVVITQANNKYLISGKSTIKII